MKYYQSILRRATASCLPWMCLLVWLFALSLISCDPVNSHPSSTADKTHGSGITTAIAFDYSGSVKGISHAGMPELVQLTDSLLVNGRAAVIVFDAISSPSEQALVRLTLQPLNSAAHLPLAQRASVAARNRALLQKNRQAGLQFLRECQDRIAWAVAKAPEQQTDLNGFLGKVAIFQQEPGVKNFKHFVFLQSDGDQDTLIKQKGKWIRNRNLKCPHWADGVNLFVCNWNTTQPCGVTQKFESVRGFLDFYFKQIKA